ncbi:hypothetical protein FOA52_007223 [Chlamydomonas sp. UWO 241]|nr:hypothetical protein FOA52_007223 [Chlamydomonas sp. UWO 241]
MHARSVTLAIASLAKTASLNATWASESAPLSPHLQQRPRGGGGGGTNGVDAAAAEAAAAHAKLARRNLNESLTREAPVPNATIGAGDRFAKFADTRHLTMQGTRLSASEMYVRKGSPEYLGYQSDDAAHDRSRAARVASHGQLGGQPLRSSEFPFPPSDSVLAAKAHQKQQYVERPLPRQHLLAKGMNLGVQGEAVFGAALLI